MMMLRRIPHAAGFPTLQREMSRLFDSLAGELPRNGNGSGNDAQTRAWIPPVDTVETPEALLVKVELPGIAPADIEISVQDGVLEIKAERTEEREGKHSGWTRFERVSGTFRRTLELPAPVEIDRIEAESRHGVLTVTLPKKAEVLPRKIPVKPS